MPVSTSGDVSHRLFSLWERSPDLDANKWLHYRLFYYSLTMKNEISAKRFLRILFLRNQNFFSLTDYLSRSKKRPPRFFFEYLRKEAHQLETSLDDAGVYFNELFPLRELAASIRWLSRASATLQQGIIRRYPQRKLKEKEIFRKDFLKKSWESFDYYTKIIKSLCREVVDLINSYYNFKIAFPQVKKASLEGKEVILQRNRKVMAAETKQEAIELLSFEYVTIARLINRFQKEVEREETVLKEETINPLLGKFQALENFYDTYFQNSELEINNKEFVGLRGYIAISLHLVEILRDLLHFQERHCNPLSKEPIHKRIIEIANQKEMKKNMCQFVLFYAAYCAKEGEENALSLLKKLLNKVSETITIPIGVDGIHARPMTWIHKISNRYGGVIFEIDGKRFEAESMLSLLTMGEAIDRVVGLEEKDSQLAISAGTVINHLEERHIILKVKGRKYTSEEIINILREFRDEMKRKGTTRYVDLTAWGSKKAIDYIRKISEINFRRENLPEELSWLIK